MSKRIDEMTREDFLALPQRNPNEPAELFDSLIILPLDDLHDSGYRCMDFVGCLNGEPICRLSGCSDVLHIDGIEGFGGFIRNALPPKGWTIDCLPGSGLLRLFPMREYRLRVGPALSSFEVFAVKENES